MSQLSLVLGEQPQTVSVDTVIVAGWAGRDRAAVERHIAELERLGVPRPSRTPVFYRVSASRLTTDAEIESTVASSGEVEPVLLCDRGQVWLGVGSDHTDRELETVSVAASKQLCDKPLASQLWAYADVVDHADELVLRSWIAEDDGEALYQEGALDTLIPGRDLLESSEPAVTDGTLMFCGTVAVRGDIRPAPAFRYELEDPVRGRTIAGRYAIRALPLVS